MFSFLGSCNNSEEAEAVVEKHAIRLAEQSFLEKNLSHSFSASINAGILSDSGEHSDSEHEVEQNDENHVDDLFPMSPRMVGLNPLSSTQSNGRHKRAVVRSSDCRYDKGQWAEECWSGSNAREPAQGNVLYLARRGCPVHLRARLFPLRILFLSSDVQNPLSGCLLAYR